MENIGVTWCDHFRGCEEYHWNQHHFMAIYRMCDHGLEIVLAIRCLKTHVFCHSAVAVNYFLPCGWRHHWVLVWHVWFLKPATCNSSPPKTPETDWQRTGLDCSCWTFAMLCRGGHPQSRTCVG